MQQKIVITGGPSTGKSTLIKTLQQEGYTCMDEISREVILEARAKGVEHLFLSSPITFSEILLNKRIDQFLQAESKTDNLVFFDRGIIDIIAYLDFSDTTHDIDFSEVLNEKKYQKVFICPPWKEIHTTDNERYESFEQAKDIHKNLLESYKKEGYDPIEIPFDTPENRVNFIINSI